MNEWRKHKDNMTASYSFQLANIDLIAFSNDYIEEDKEPPKPV